MSNRNGLPKIELIIYFVIYCLCLIYGIYLIYLISEDEFLWEYSGFSAGWSILDRKRDDLDFEWETWKQFILSNYLWFIGHLLLSELVRCRWPKLIPAVHFSIGFTFLSIFFNLKISMFIFLINFLYVVIMDLKNIRLIWLFTIASIIMMNFMKYEESLVRITIFFGINEMEMYVVIIIISWNILKSISFALDYISVKINQPSVMISFIDRKDPFTLYNYFGYIYYFPNLVLGPCILYSRYSQMLTDSQIVKRSNRWDRIYHFIWMISRVSFCLILTDFSLHFLYISNLLYHPEIVSTVNPWAIYTLGYLMGQFFFNKYFVCYGLSLTVAEMDTIKSPGLPKCIGRIHHYSDMWRYFDQGLYEFLFKYIYIPTCRKTPTTTRKLFGNILTFIFIYLWHGFYNFVIIWAGLNFICLQIELFIRKLSLEKMWWSRWLSPNGQQRLMALIGSQLFIPAVMSNFFFISGLEIGILFFRETYLSGHWISYTLLTGCCYCIYNVSEAISRWEKGRNKKEKFN